MLYLEKHKVDYRDGLSYYAFVEDNYPGKPHRVVSELRFFDIFPFKQDYRLIDSDDGEPLSGELLTLEELIARQRVNLSRTFVLEHDGSANERATMKLATFEEELAAATAEFSAGLNAVGVQILALDEAATAMRSATRSLDARDLRSAVSKRNRPSSG